MALRGATAQAQFAASMGQTIDGISCDAQEGQRIHIHQHLVIFDHGKQVSIPNNVGQPAGRPCIYWLHTHTPDGIIHIEAPLDRSFTLGDFFKVWGQPIGRTQQHFRVGAERSRVGDPIARLEGSDLRAYLLDHIGCSLLIARREVSDAEAATEWQAASPA